MNSPDRERQLEYGDEAVERPADSALGYGNTAVAQGTLVAQAPPKKKKQQTQTSQKPNRVTVNPESALDGAELSKLLRSGSIPKALRQKVKFSSKSKRIELPQTLPAAKGQEWIDDLLHVGEDWEVTTARLVIVVDDTTIRGQKLEPKIQTDEERGRISDGEVGLMPIAADSHSMGDGMFLGKTVPNERLSNKKSGTEIVNLDSTRGLVIVVTSIVVKKGDKVTVDAIDVPDVIVAKTLVHELAGHAGLFSQGKETKHGDPRVEKNVKQIDALFKSKAAKKEKKLQEDVQTYIEAMQKAQ